VLLSWPSTRAGVHLNRGWSHRWCERQGQNYWTKLQVGRSECLGCIDGVLLLLHLREGGSLLGLPVAS